MKKNVLVLSSFPANYRVAAIEGLRKDYDLTIVFNAVQDENRNPDWFVKNDKVPYYVMNTPENRKKARRAIGSLRQYDLIFAYDWSMPWVLAILFRAVLLGIPYILNSDGIFWQKKGFPKDQIKRFYKSHAAAAVASGTHARDAFVIEGTPANRIFCHNFTSIYRADILDKPVSASEKAALRAELGLPEKTTFLSIGQFIERKGFDILLNAWHAYGAKDAQLVILGGGDLKPQYEAMIAENEIANVILSDFVPFDQVWKYYKASDAFALATREDIWGLVVNESMACGLPVIVSDRCIAGLELIENDQNGYIVPLDDRDAWVRAFSAVAENAELRDRMGRANLEKIRDWCMEETNRIDREAAAFALAT